MIANGAKVRVDKTGYLQSITIKYNHERYTEGTIADFTGSGDSLKYFVAIDDMKVWVHHIHVKEI